MVRRNSDNDEILIYASGQYDKKSVGKQAGCAVVFEIDGSLPRSNPTAFPVERQGPRGRKMKRPNKVTAALRAVVAALELKIWSSEGWKQVTIATDCYPVYEGLTQLIVGWGAKGLLKETSPSRLDNRDLWSHALILINEQSYHGCGVKIWHIKAEQNTRAANMALAAASSAPVPATYKHVGDVSTTWKELVGV